MDLEQRRARLRLRLLKHHLPLFGGSVVAGLALYLTRPYKDVISRASFATAYPALGLLALTLLVGPWRVLRQVRQPTSDDLRRDIGIWAGVLGVLHSVIGQCVHLRGRPWLYYVYDGRSRHAFPLRRDLFGLANYTGAIGLLVIVVLLATSNDYSLRRLGTPRWKRLQRWNYALLAMVGLHAFGYQAIEKQHWPYVMTAAILAGVTLVFQLIGFGRRRRRVKIRA